MGELLSVPVLYRVDENGEASYDVIWFCSESCRRIYKTIDKVAAGMNADWADGTVCDECEKPLP